MSRRRRAQRAHLHLFGGTFRLGVVLAVLVGVNIYVFFFSAGSLRQVSQATQAASTLSSVALHKDADAGSDAPAQTALAEEAPPPGSVPIGAGPAVAQKSKPRRHEGTIKERDGLGSVMRREGLLPKDADAAMRALAPIMNFRKELHPGLAYSVRLDAGGRLEAFELKVAAGVVCAVTRGLDGKLTAERLATASRVGHH